MTERVVIIMPDGKKEYDLSCDLSLTDLRSLDTIDLGGCLYGIDDIRLKVYHKPVSSGYSSELLTFVKRVEILLGPVDTDRFYWANPDGAQQTRIDLSRNQDLDTPTSPPEKLNLKKYIPQAGKKKIPSPEEKEVDLTIDAITPEEKELKINSLCEQDEAEGDYSKARERRFAFDMYGDEPLRPQQTPGHSSYDPRLDIFHKEFDFDFHTEWICDRDK